MMSSTGQDFWQKTKFKNLAHRKQASERPALELEYPKNSRIIDLPAPKDIDLLLCDLRKAIENRTSIRHYNDEEITLEELSYLLWCTQGVKEVIPAVTTFRNVPSAGSCHAFETYLLINRVKGLIPGLYRFLALKHSLLPVDLGEGIADMVTSACLKQSFILTSAVTFLWAAVSERMISRYGERGYRYLLLDAGHVCQNLYLSAQSIHCGVCAIAAYDDDQLNTLLQLDGTQNFVVYLATLGRKRD